VEVVDPPCKETAKSTRSDFPSPRSVDCAARSRLTRSQIQRTPSRASTAQAAAPIAIQAAVAEEKLMNYATEKMTG
jgi:hypothetical protein